MKWFGYVPLSDFHALEIENARLQEAHKILSQERERIEAEHAKQKLGNQVLWTAISRTQRIHEPVQPGTIRSLLKSR